MAHGAKLAWASHMGYVGAFGTNIHPESKKRTLKAPAESPELRTKEVVPARKGVRDTSAEDGRVLGYAGARIGEGYRG